MRPGNVARRLPQIDPVETPLDETIREASSWLAARQAADGHWVFELEADATIPSEYVLLNHFLGEIDDRIERKIARYLRRTQGEHGGWPLFPGGEFDISASVKAYYALKINGDSPDAPHMRRAREAILARGGAARTNVFARIMLALFGQVPWRAVPGIPVEAMLLPKWSPFHVEKVSYWSRACMVPLFILYALKPRAKNPRGVDIRELFVAPPDRQRRYQVNPTGNWLGEALLKFDGALRVAEPMAPRLLQRNAIDAALAFIKERLNGVDGLGGIYPAMAYALMAFRSLGYPPGHPDCTISRQAIERLVVERAEEAYMQPCVSPVWDTGLAMHALFEAGAGGDSEAIGRAATWLTERQILDVRGDWTANRGDVSPGGWAFQYRNDYYPDVDDTAVVVMALHRADAKAHANAIARGAEWIIGMQSRNGGWGAFDADNEYYLLDHIPFADHGALLDPPTDDVTARCLGMLAQLGHGTGHPAVARALKFLQERQEPNGSWFGRWGTNYVYGTWSVLNALNAVGEDMQAPYIRRAVAWLKGQQRGDGGWGESCETYWPERRARPFAASLPSQTAWALLGLMAAGEVDSEAVRCGIDHLLEAPRDGGQWREDHYNAVGFPRVFYLKYYGYSAYFPLWALARYRNLRQGDRRRTTFGL